MDIYPAIKREAVEALARHYEFRPMRPNEPVDAYERELALWIGVYTANDYDYQRTIRAWLAAPVASARVYGRTP